MSDKRVAVVTGGNRGIGLEVCRQLAEKYRDSMIVVMGVRDEAKGRASCEKLRKNGADVRYHRLDVADEDSVHAFGKWVESEFGRWDILINNAGVVTDRKDTPLTVSRKAFRDCLEVNVLGVLSMYQAALPLMRKNNYGRIVNVSSGAGAHSRGLAAPNPAHPAYRVSKAALNGLTRIMATECKGDNVLVNVMNPGWVPATDMGSQQSPGLPPTPIEEAGETAVWLATLPDDGPRGGYFQKQKQLEW